MATLEEDDDDGDKAVVQDNQDLINDRFLHKNMKKTKR